MELDRSTLTAESDGRLEQFSAQNPRKPERVIHPHALIGKRIEREPLRAHLAGFRGLPFSRSRDENVHLLVPFRLLYIYEIDHRRFFQMLRENRHAGLFFHLPHRPLRDRLALFYLAAEAVPLPHPEPLLLHPEEYLAVGHQEAERRNLHGLFYL